MAKSRLKRYKLLEFDKLQDILKLLVTAKPLGRVLIQGYPIWTDTDRYESLYVHGCKCAKCGLEASFAAIEKETSSKDKFHINVYGTRKSDGKTSAIQIKPITFFKSKRNDVHQDRVNLIHKYYNFLNDYNLKTYYAIYLKDNDNGNIFWLKNGDGFRFRLNEVFDYDVNNIDNTLRTKYLKDDFHYLDF